MAQVKLFKNIMLKKYLNVGHPIIVVNAAVVLLFLTMALYVKLGHLDGSAGSRANMIKEMFAETFHSRLHQGLLTTLSEILWCVAFTICLFGFSLLQQVQPERKVNLFVLCSAFIVGLFLMDDVFRLTLLLYSYANFPKAASYLFYGVATIGYGFIFRKVIRRTPYFLLAIGLSLLVISGIADLVHVRGDTTPIVLEDGSKLLGILNIVMYYWYTCRQQFAKLLL
jgi:hypothetical protein